MIIHAICFLIKRGEVRACKGAAFYWWPTYILKMTGTLLIGQSTCKIVHVAYSSEGSSDLKISKQVFEE